MDGQQGRARQGKARQGKNLDRLGVGVGQWASLGWPGLGYWDGLDVSPAILVSAVSAEP